MTPARILAPAALVAAAIALFAVLASGGSDGEREASPVATVAPAESATPKPQPKATARPGGSTYTVKPGDTPSGIAEKANVDVDDLLALNPDVDPDALTVGDELKLP